MTTDPSGSAKAGETIKMNIEAVSGYHAEGIYALAASGELLPITGNTFIMPDMGVYVGCSFEADKAEPEPDEPDSVLYDINHADSSTSAWDHVTYNHSGNAYSGDKVIYTPKEGYKITSFEVKTDMGKDLTETEENGAYSFIMPSISVTVSCEMEKTGISINHETNPDTNTFSADIKLSDQSVLDMLRPELTEDELAGKEDIIFYMEVKEMADTAVPAADKSAITEKADRDTIAVYLDIQLLKKVGNQAPVAIRNTNGDVPITMQLPDTIIPATRGHNCFYIIYYHDGQAKSIPASFDNKTNTLTFNANEFSTYALIYTNPADVDVPKTGDESHPFAWAMAFCGCMILLAGAVIPEKKRAR